jgi:hypothetical protein
LDKKTNEIKCWGTKLKEKKNKKMIKKEQLQKWGLNLEKKENKIKWWGTKLKEKTNQEKKKNNNQDNEYHIWHKN